MLLLAANTVGVGTFSSEKVQWIRLCPGAVKQRAWKATFPRVQVRGKGEYANVIIRWEPVIFWRSRWFVDAIPALWRVVRVCYTPEGVLKDEKLLREIVRKEGLGEIALLEDGYITHSSAIHCGPNSSWYVSSIEGDKFVFPRYLKAFAWRPALLVTYTEEPRYGLCEGYVSLTYTVDAMHTGLGSHWAPVQNCDIEFTSLPTRDDIEHPVELWKQRVAWAWQDWASTLAGRWKDRIRLEVVSFASEPCRWVIRGAYGYKNGGPARPIERTL